MNAAQAKTHYELNRETILSSRRDRYAANREVLKKENKARWLRKSPEERKRLHRERQVKHVYHLDREAHQEFLRKQNFRCPITGDVVDIHSAVDHDHKCCPGEGSCGKCIRGILSRRANSALGVFEKDPESLLRAYQYLKGEQCHQK